MASVYFQNSDGTKLFSSSGYITESNINWAILSNTDASSVSSIEDSGSNLSVTNGVGTITTTSSTGTKIVIIQSSASNFIDAYLMTVV